MDNISSAQISAICLSDQELRKTLLQACHSLPVIDQVVKTLIAQNEELLRRFNLPIKKSDCVMTALVHAASQLNDPEASKKNQKEIEAQIKLLSKLKAHIETLESSIQRTHELREKLNQQLCSTKTPRS